MFLLPAAISLSGQQDSLMSIPEINLSTIAQENSGNSYITFPADIGNLEPLWFEANVIPNFNLRTSKDSRLMGVVTPQIILRMYQQESFPVSTPSYIPQITVYYSLRSHSDVKSFSAFLKLAHYSNGQDGDFYNEDGTINTKNGNFATNYFEPGIIRTRYNARFNAVQFFSTSFEVNPAKLTIDELHGIYSRFRWHNTLSFFKIPRDYKREKKASISLKGEFTWLFGDVNDWKTLSDKRLNLKFTFYYHPRFFEDIGLFIQFYRGMDYYNIYFNHQITVLRFGIMTEKLRF
jgi:hypothetical protein